VNIIKKNKFHPLVFLIIIAVIIVVPLINYARIYSEENSNPSLTVTEGVDSGDVTHDSVIIWSRVNKPSTMHVESNSVYALVPTTITKEEVH
jgi:phosphodiesterase/alkaline phosphatase D-like protein